MKIIENQTLTGERAAFHSRETKFVSCVFKDGESPIKESSDVEVENCSFEWKYPLWYTQRAHVAKSHWDKMGRAGVWYTSDISVEDCRIDAPKNFRKCHRVQLKNVIFTDGQETLWWNDGVELENIKAENAPYFGMGSKNVKAKNLVLNGDYAFDGGENIEIEDSILNTKDAFWNCKRVTLRNCTVIGQYFGWNSEDVTLIHCHVESNQGFCYMNGIKLVDCSLDHTDLAFEYCHNVDVDCTTVIDSVKNPYEGRIKAKGIKELILDPKEIDPSKTEILLG